MKRIKEMKEIKEFLKSMNGKEIFADEELIFEGYKKSDLIEFKSDDEWIELKDNELSIEDIKEIYIYEDELNDDEIYQFMILIDIYGGDSDCWPGIFRFSLNNEFNQRFIEKE